MKPKDPVRENPRAVKETNRCPFCGGKLRRHCGGPHCNWLKCGDRDRDRCLAYGPETGMVLP
jgi:hypothetical protein